MSWSDDLFTEVFDALYPGVCRYVERMLGRTGVAQEVAAEAFLRLYRLGPAKLEPGQERFWVYRVATNLAINELRRARRRTKVLDAVAFLTRRTAASPHDEVEEAERDRRLGKALDRLPDHQRSAFVLREQEGFSYAEIASVLGVSLAKVKVDIFRARSALREDLGAQTSAPGRTLRRAP